MVADRGKGLAVPGTGSAPCVVPSTFSHPQQNGAEIGATLNGEGRACRVVHKNRSVLPSLEGKRA